MKYKITTTLCSIVIAINTLFAQHSDLPYYMLNVPQSNLVNPATQPKCLLYIGFPGISPLEIYADNSALSVNNIIKIDPSTDSTITFMHPSEDINDFLKNFKSGNFISTEYGLSLASIGFRINSKTFFSLQAQSKTYIDFMYPSELASLLFTLPDKNQHYSFDNFGLSANSYIEYGFGLSKSANDRFTFGVRVKLLSGIANMKTNNAQIELTTDTLSWDIRMKYEANACIPGYSLEPDNEGNADFANASFDETSIYKNLFGKNIGFGIDFGFHYKILDQLVISASLIDLGYIGWKEDVYKLSKDTSYLYEGIPLIVSGDSMTIEDGFIDSLVSNFNPELTVGEPYNTMLKAKIYIGVNYLVHKNISISALSRTEINQGRLREQLTLAANFSPSDYFSASISYSIINSTYDNFGLGLSGRAGPFNIYAMFDYVSMFYYQDVTNKSIIIPKYGKTISARLGLNLVIGWKEHIKDLPLIY